VDCSSDLTPSILICGFPEVICGISAVDSGLSAVISDIQADLIILSPVPLCDAFVAHF